MSHESRPQNKPPSKASRPKNRGGDIAFGKEFEQVIGETIRKTVSEYHGLLRHSLNKELKQIVGDYEQATSGISKPVSSGVKDQLTETIRREVRQVFDNALFNPGNARTKPSWLKGANSQWKSDDANPDANVQSNRGGTDSQQPDDQAKAVQHQDNSGVRPSQRPQQGLSTEGQSRQETAYTSSANKHLYKIGSIPAFEPKPVQEEPEADLQSEIDETGESNPLDKNVSPQYHQYQMNGVPEYQPKQSGSEPESSYDSPAEDFQQENVYVEERPSKVADGSDNEVTPPSSSFWVLPHGENSEQHHEEVGENHQENEKSEGKHSYLDSFMLPQPTPEQDAYVAPLPAPTDYEELSATTASFLGIKDAGGEEELPYFYSVAEMAEDDISIDSPEENEEEIEDDSVPYFISEAELAYEEVQEYERPSENDSPLQIVSEAELAYEEVQDDDQSEESSSELVVPDPAPSEAAPTETALAAILEAVRDLKVVIHDSNQVVHVADGVEEEPSKVEIYTPQDSSDDEVPELLAIASASVEESEDSISDTEEEQPVESDDATETPSISEEAYVEEEPSAELTEADDDLDISEEPHAEEESAEEAQAEEAQEIDDSPIEAVSQDEEHEEEKPDEAAIADSEAIETVVSVEEEFQENEDLSQEEVSAPVAELEEPIISEDEPDVEIATEEAVEEATEEVASVAEQPHESLEGEIVKDETVSEEDDLIEIVDEDEELTEETVKKAVFEGTVRLNVEANGCIKEIVHFVRELRQKPQLRLLRLVGNNREGVDIWLGLREPLRLKSILPEMDGISIITKPLPHIGSPDERLLSVRLSRVSVFEDSEEMIAQGSEQPESEPVGAANP